MTLRETAHAAFEAGTRQVYAQGGYYRLRRLEKENWVSLEAVSLDVALHHVLDANEAWEIVYPTGAVNRMQSKKVMKEKKNMPVNKTPKKLATPQGVMADSIITKDWVGKELIIESVEATTTGYGAAFIAQGHAPRSKKSESVLIGASVLVKTIQGYLDQGGEFPISVTTEKAPGKRYFVFAE